MAGGYKALAIVLAIEMCDLFASTQYNTDFVTFLSTVMNLPFTKASQVFTAFAATSTIIVMLGALLSDSYSGRFRAIIIGLILYELGLAGTTILAAIPSLRPPQCLTLLDCQVASAEQLSILCVTHVLYALGCGLVRPCILAFAADQVETPNIRTTVVNPKFASLYYFPILLCATVTLLLMYYIRKKVGWVLAFGMPTIVIGIALVVFVSGSRLYRKVQPGGSSPLTRFAQVIAATFRKRKLVLPEDHSLLYQNTTLDAAISTHRRFGHTVQFKCLGCLDKAAIVTDADRTDTSSPNLWHISTVQRVDELKSIIRMLPIWFAGTILISTYTNIQNFNTMQSRTLDRHITPSSSFEIPIAFLFIINYLTALVSLFILETVLVPLIRRITKRPEGITSFQRIGIGLAVFLIAAIAQALVEMKRKSVARKHGLIDQPSAILPVSIYWIILLQVLHGLGDALVWVGQLDILSDLSPENIRATAMSLYWASIALGNYLSLFIVAMVYKGTGNKWLPHRNLNRAKLEYYHWLMAGIQVVNIIYYGVCAYYYTREPPTAQQLENRNVELVQQNRLQEEIVVELGECSTASGIRRETGESSTSRLDEGDEIVAADKSD